MREVQTDHQLDSLQWAMLDRPGDFWPGARLMPQPEEHLFLPGLYVRQITNPRGSLGVTMKHKTEHPFFVLRGHLRVKDLGTGEIVELRAGDRGVTRPGTQRLILALEDTVFVTVHPNPDNETDLAKLEERFIERQELADGRTAGERWRSMLLEGGPE